MEWQQHKPTSCRVIGSYLFLEHTHSIQQEGAMMRGEDADGVQIRRTDPLHRLQVVVAVVEKSAAILGQLEEGEPLQDNVGDEGATAPLPLLGGHRHQGHQGHGDVVLVGPRPTLQHHYGGGLGERLALMETERERRRSRIHKRQEWEGGR